MTILSMRNVVLFAVLALGAGPAAGPQGGRSGTAADSLLQQVRVALGHGAVTDARRLADSSTEPQPAKDLASALVDIFEGKNEEARQKLEPLARANPIGDAALELGLLDLRQGRRDDGWKRLDPIASNRTFKGPEDYYRLARAARGSREFLLANDAFFQIDKLPRADIQTDLGDLFLERHQPGDALGSYRKALELDPEWVPAHVGVARALELVANADPEAARLSLETARKIAPNHPEVLRLAAERALEKENFAGANEALDRLATSRPGTVEEAALRVPLAYEAGGPAAVEAAVARVREIDPKSALGYRRPANRPRAGTGSTKPRSLRARRRRTIPTTRRRTSISACT